MKRKKRFVMTERIEDGNRFVHLEMAEGFIEVAVNSKYAGGRNSIIHFFIKEPFRGKGLSYELLDAAKRRFNSLSAQASNEKSVRSMYKSGFRLNGDSRFDLKDAVEQVNKYPFSVNMRWSKI